MLGSLHVIFFLGTNEISFLETLRIFPFCQLIGLCNQYASSYMQLLQLNVVILIVRKHFFFAFVCSVT